MGEIIMACVLLACVFGIGGFLCFIGFEEPGGSPLILFGVLIILFGIGLSMFIWDEVNPPSGVSMIELRSDRWGCTASHTTTSMIMVGKVWVPQTHRVCDQYSRIEG